MNIENWLNAIATSISGISVPQTIEDGDPCLTAICEPDGVDDEYFEYSNDSIHEWVNLIGTTFGPDWKRAAEYVKENGY